MDENYIPYGPEWEKAILKLNKTQMMNMLKQSFMKSSQLEPQVNQATCGYCKDCKFWDDENVECTKDIVWVLSQNSYLKINDLKTQRYFGCTQFESKLSG